MMEERSLIMQKYVAKLVQSLTGFKPNNDNYKICVDFTWSHFKHHRFLSVNSHEIMRDIEGICQKFKLNNFHDEERVVRKLFEHSLSHEIAENHYQKEVMYSIISLLMSLAYDPINKLKDKKRKGIPIFIKFQNNEKEENLTARQHFIDSLLQDNFFVTKNDADSDLSEWTESEDDEMHKSNTEESENESKESQILISSCLRPPQKPCVYTKIKLDNSLKWLHENVQNAWWNVDEVTFSEVTGNHKAANFHNEWQLHLTRKSLGFIKKQPVSLLSEYCLLREILWMFLNPVDCKFFKIENSEISLRPNVCLPSTTIETLQIFLKNFIRPMNVMHRLKIDIENSLKNPGINHTLENYYGLIRKFLDEIINFFIDEEEIVKEGEGIYTIITLHGKMQPHSKMLEMLWNIHKTCILTDEKYPSHIQSLYLIANLNYLVHNCAYKEEKNLSVTFFLTCLKTYIQIFDVWWTEARLDDSKMEFIVEKVLIEDIEFIRPRLISKCKERAFYINEKISNKILEDEIISIFNSFAVEACFTLEVISQVDRIHEMKQIGDATSLYEKFIESITDEIQKLASNKNCMVTENIKMDEPKLSNNQKLVSSIGSEMMAENDEIMFLIFNSTFESLTIKEDTVEISPIEMYKSLNNATECLFLPLEGSIKRIINELLSKKIAVAERFVMDIYFKEFQVEHYLQEVRKVYFLESNELINLFNLSLFPQMEKGEKWANSYLLTVLFNEVLSSKDLTLFTVHVNKTLGHKSVLEAIDELTIYLNINNNFDNIFTSSCITKYNEVFRFLLKIKWAQKILNCLRFPDFYKHRLPYAKFTMLDLVIKRLSLTRFAMQHAITMVHNHIMVTLQGLSCKFEENVAKTNKITDLITFHDTFVESFHSKALLGDESKRTRGIVIEVLKLAKVVANEWQNISTFHLLDSTGKTFDDSVSLTKLNVNTIEIEKAFKLCEKQLKDLFYH